MTPSKRVQRLIRQENAKAREQKEHAQTALGYARVSTDEQARKGYGLQAQERAIRAFAESQGYDLLSVVRDAGISGATPPDKREGFGEILELAKARAFSILLVWKIDRLARSIVYAITTANELRESHSVTLRSVTEPIDLSTAMGQTLFSILAGMAQQERQSITERTLAGKRAKASRGGFAGGTAPYGFRTNGHGGLVVHDAEAEVVRQIFAARSAGETLKQIADGLNAEGVPTRRGAKWYPATIRYVLDNPKYRGEVEYFFRWETEKTRVIREGEHEPIIGSRASS